MKMNNKGFGAVEVILILVIVGILGFVGYRAYIVYTADTENGSGQNKYGFQKKDSNLTNYEVKDLNVSFSYPKTWGDVTESSISETASDNSQTNIGTKITFAEFKENELAINLYTKRLSGGGSGCVSTIECVSFTESIVYKATYKFVKDGDSAKITMINDNDVDGAPLIDETKIISIVDSKLLFRNDYNFTLADVIKNANEIGDSTEQTESDFNSYIAEAHNQHHFAVLNGKNGGPFIGGNAYFTPEGEVDQKQIDEFIAFIESLEIN